MSGRTLGLLAVAVASGWCGTGRAHATDLRFIQVAQPLHDPNDGTCAFRVTCGAWLASAIPGYAIRHTRDPNLIPIPGVPAPRNHNAANLLGIKLRVGASTFADRSGVFRVGPSRLPR